MNPVVKTSCLCRQISALKNRAVWGRSISCAADLWVVGLDLRILLLLIDIKVTQKIQTMCKRPVFLVWWFYPGEPYVKKQKRKKHHEYWSILRIIKGKDGLFQQPLQKSRHELFTGHWFLNGESCLENCGPLMNTPLAVTSMTSHWVMGVPVATTQYEF